MVKTGKGEIELVKVIAILSISAVISLPGLAVSPILGDMKQIFTDASDLKIQMLSALPNLLIIPFSIITGQLSIKYDNIKLLRLGLALFAISGVISFFAKSINTLLIISTLIGIGAGIILPLSKGFICDYFEGRYRVKQLGFSSGINNGALILATSLSGYLATINWHLPFLIYTLPLVVLWLTYYLKSSNGASNNILNKNLLQDVKQSIATDSNKQNLLQNLQHGEQQNVKQGVQQDVKQSVQSIATDSNKQNLLQNLQHGEQQNVKQGVQQNVKQSEHENVKQNLQQDVMDSSGQDKDRASNNFRSGGFFSGMDIKKIAGYSALYFLITYAALVIVFFLSIVLEKQHISSEVSGTMISLFFFAIMLPGFFINYILNRLHEYTAFTSLLLMAAGLLLIYYVDNIYIIGLGCFINGIGYGILQPFIYEKTSSASDTHKVTMAMSLVLAFNYIATVLCPFIMDVILKIFRLKADIDTFVINAILLIIMAIWAYLCRKGELLKRNMQQ